MGEHLHRTSGVLLLQVEYIATRNITINGYATVVNSLIIVQSRLLQFLNVNTELK